MEVVTQSGRDAGHIPGDIDCVFFGIQLRLKYAATIDFGASEFDKETCDLAWLY